MSNDLSIINLTKEYFLLNINTTKRVFLVCFGIFFTLLFGVMVISIMSGNKSATIPFALFASFCFSIFTSISVILLAFIQSNYNFIKRRWFLNKPEWKSFIKNNNFKITMLHPKWNFSEESLMGKIKAFPVRIHVDPYNFIEAECFFFIEMKDLNKDESTYYRKQFEEQDAFFHGLFIIKKFKFSKNEGAYDLQIQLEEFANYLAVCNYKPIQLEEAE